MTCEVVEDSKWWYKGGIEENRDLCSHSENGGQQTRKQYEAYLRIFCGDADKWRQIEKHFQGNDEPLEGETGFT
jgi:hypothetical protein